LGVINEESIGFPVKTSNDDTKDIKRILIPYLDTFTFFRTKIREVALNHGSNADILNLCDEMRDVVMPHLGIRIIDDGDFPFDFVDKKVLLKESSSKLSQKLDSLRSKLLSKKK